MADDDGWQHGAHHRREFGHRTRGRERPGCGRSPCRDDGPQPRTRRGGPRSDRRRQQDCLHRTPSCRPVGSCERPVGGARLPRQARSARRPRRQCRRHLPGTHSDRGRQRSHLPGQPSRALPGVQNARARARGRVAGAGRHRLERRPSRRTGRNPFRRPHLRTRLELLRRVRALQAREHHVLLRARTSACGNRHQLQRDASRTRPDGFRFAGLRPLRQADRLALTRDRRDCRRRGPTRSCGSPRLARYATSAVCTTTAATRTGRQGRVSTSRHRSVCGTSANDSPNRRGTARRT